MSEKVLGFFEKDSDKFEERLNFPTEITIDETLGFRTRLIFSKNRSAKICWENRS